MNCERNICYQQDYNGGCDTCPCNRTAKEAIENLKKLKSFHNGSYGSSIRMAIEALEKQVPKKPKEQGTGEKTHYKCPECGWIPLTIYSDGYHLGNKPKYCERCGQAIDWSEEDE